MLSGRAMFLLHAEDVEEMPDGWTPSDNKLLNYYRDYQPEEFFSLFNGIHKDEPKWKIMIRLREHTDYSDVWQYLIDKMENPMEGY